MTESLQKHELLRKLLNMTSSSNDAEALLAIRKANQLLLDQKWSWDLLLAAKIKVVGDPWAGMAQPPKPQPAAEPPLRDKAADYATAYGAGARKAPRPNPQPQPQPTYQPPPQRPRPTPPSPTIASTRSNAYSGHCYCCGNFVPSGQGWLFKPSAGLEVVCDSCNKSSAPIPTKRARKRTATVTDILSGF